MSDVLINFVCVWCVKLLSVEEVVSVVECVLLIEVCLILKFGLVDICNVGVYWDMDLVLFEVSIVVVVLWMEKFFIMGYDIVVVVLEYVLMMLCLVGMVCENDMLEVIGGVNIYCGVIFVFGLFSVVVGRLVLKGELIEQYWFCDQVVCFCCGMVMQELFFVGGEWFSKGEVYFLCYGFFGVCGEVESGFLMVCIQVMLVFICMMEEIGDSNLVLL